MLKFTPGPIIELQPPPKQFSDEFYAAAERYFGKATIHAEAQELVQQAFDQAQTRVDDAMESATEAGERAQEAIIAHRTAEDTIKTLSSERDRQVKVAWRGGIDAGMAAPRPPTFEHMLGAGLMHGFREDAVSNKYADNIRTDIMQLTVEKSRADPDLALAHLTGMRLAWTNITEFKDPIRLYDLTKSSATPVAKGANYDQLTEQIEKYVYPVEAANDEALRDARYKAAKQHTPWITSRLSHPTDKAGTNRIERKSYLELDKKAYAFHPEIDMLLIDMTRMAKSGLHDVVQGKEISAQTATATRIRGKAGERTVSDVMRIATESVPATTTTYKYPPVPDFTPKPPRDMGKVTVRKPKKLLLEGK